jgi:hypothetical protein
MSTTRNGIEEKVNPIFEKLYDPNGYQLNLLENLNNVSDMKYLTKYALTERDERSIKFSGFSTNK